MQKELQITFAQGINNKATMIIGLKTELKDVEVVNVLHDADATNMYRILTGNKEFVESIRKGGEASERV